MYKISRSRIWPCRRKATLTVPTRCHNSVAARKTTLEKSVIDVERSRTEMQSKRFTKQNMNTIQTCKWNNCSGRYNNASTKQNDLIYEGTRVFIPISSQKQAIKNFHDVHHRSYDLRTFVKMMLVAVYG